MHRFYVLTWATDKHVKKSVYIKHCCYYHYGKARINHIFSCIPIPFHDMRRIHTKKIALERLPYQILTLFLYLLISVYPITTSRVSISANFKPQSFAALNNSFSSTASMATSTSLSASSLKYFSVFCF